MASCHLILLKFGTKQINYKTFICFNIQLIFNRIGCLLSAHMGPLDQISKKSAYETLELFRFAEIIWAKFIWIVLWAASKLHRISEKRAKNVVLIVRSY